MTEHSHSHSEHREVENNRYSGIRVKTFLFVGQLLVGKSIKAQIKHTFC